MEENQNKSPMPVAMPPEHRAQLELTPLSPDEFLEFKKSFDDQKSKMHPDVRMGISRLMATVEFTVQALGEAMTQMVSQLTETEDEEEPSKH